MPPGRSKPSLAQCDMVPFSRVSSAQAGGGVVVFRWWGCLARAPPGAAAAEVSADEAPEGALRLAGGFAAA